MMDGRVIFLLGPTAAGKTDLALALCQCLPLDIISVDSAQVYRHMNIGTAKPDAETLSRYPHQLIDLINPDQAYSAAQFCGDAAAAIRASHDRGRVPLLAGGTMLYARALMQGMSRLPPADPVLRAELAEQAAAIGWPAMHAELARHDPVSAARLQPNDAQRVQRALEVWRLTGVPLSSLQVSTTTPPRFPFQSLVLGLMPADRGRLHQRIADRFNNMLAQGLVDELDGLRRNFELNPQMPSMRSVGYRQAWEYLDGKLDQAGLTEKGITATRQLAKRQMTWLRSMAKAELFDSLDKGAPTAILERSQQFLADCPGNAAGMERSYSP